MREIKLRIWDIDERKFIVNEIDRLGCGDTKKCMSERVNFENNSVEINADERYIFSEYTGLEDKNGKEIYEGDIVKFRANHGIGVIKYSDEWGAFVVEYIKPRPLAVLGMNYYKEDIEVLGNIYQNPELLGEQ